MTMDSMERTIGRLEGKVDGLSARLANVEINTNQIETRTRGLENWRWKVTGIAAGVSGLVAYLIQAL